MVLKLHAAWLDDGRGDTFCGKAASLVDLADLGADSPEEITCKSCASILDRIDA